MPGGTGLDVGLVVNSCGRQEWQVGWTALFFAVHARLLAGVAVVKAPPAEEGRFSKLQAEVWTKLASFPGDAVNSCSALPSTCFM